MMLFLGRMNNLIKAFVFGAVFTALFFTADSVSAATVQFHLRHQNTVFFEGEAELPVAGFTTLTDSDGVGHDINAKSVLNVLSSVDSASNDFSISNLQYFSSFSSFYVKCIEIPAKSTTACDNWQYVVDGTYPSVGMDSYVLSGNENIWIYFGDIRKAFAQQGSFKTDNPFIFSAEQYQYEINGWAPVTGYTIGIKKGSTVVATQAVDSQGKATFTVTEPGDYTAGIVQDFYFPSTAFYVDLFVPSLGPTGSAAPPPPPAEPVVEKVFNVEAAVDFLTALQKEDGSLSDSSSLNDWAAIALTGNGRLITYLASDPNPGDLLTDYERRAMVLMAQGINPYSGTATNYITKILEGFDGTQFGSKDLANDDMFAVIPLLKAGYTIQDAEIEKAIAFILSWQQSNGSWSDVDNTAAAIQALVGAKDKLEVQSALDRAKLYLISQKKEDGTFGNAYSTSWALQALKVLGENVSSAGLATFQAGDGGLLENDSLNNRIWATAYAIPAALGKPWGDILQSFEKEAELLKEAELQAVNLSGTSSELVPDKLLAIQEEVEKIQLAVEALQPQVALLYNQYLASLPKVDTVARINQEIEQVRNEIASLQTKETEFQADEAAEERNSVSAQKELSQAPDVTTQTASVAESLPSSNGLGARQVALLVVAGFAIFFLAGGTNLASPFLRKILVRT